MALFRQKKATAADIVARVPVWRALSQVFIPEEKTPAEFGEIALRLAVSPFSEDEIKRILFGELHSPLSLNLFADPLGCWEIEFPDDLLLEKLIPRIGRRPFPGPLVLFRRWINDHLTEILARFRRLRAEMSESRDFSPKRPSDDYIVGVVAKDGPTGAMIDPEGRLMSWDKVTTYRELSVPFVAWRRVYGPIEDGPIVVSDILSPSYFNDHLKRIRPDRTYLVRVRFRTESPAKLVALLDQVTCEDSELSRMAAERTS